MKKIFLFLFLFFTAFTSWAGSIKVISGDIAVFNNNGITASLIFDYSNLKIEGTPYQNWLKEKGNDYVRDWPEQCKASEEYFIRCWNKDNDKGLQVTSSEGKEYYMIIDAREMDMGSAAASMFVGFGAGGAKLTGTMYIFKQGCDIPCLTVEIDGQTGRSAVTEMARRIDLYGELAEDMVKTIKKTKASKVSPAKEPVKIGNIGGKLSSTDNNTTISKEKTAKSAKDRKSAEKQVTKSNKEATSKKEVINHTSDNNYKIEYLNNAKGNEIPKRRKPYLGDFEGLNTQKYMGVYFDFANAEILGRSEEGFIKYMKTSAGKRDKDSNFDITWENDLKPSLEDLFISEVNAELKDEDIRLRLSSSLDTDYVLKLEILEIDEDGNNLINFLIVDMSNGEVKAQITCKSDGGRVGRFSGLINQGFESAAKNFSEIFIDKID